MAAQADGHMWGSLLLGEVWPDSGGQAQTMNRDRERFFLARRELKTLSLSQPHEFWGIKEQEHAQEVSVYRKSKISKRQSNGKGSRQGKNRRHGMFLLRPPVPQAVGVKGLARQVAARNSCSS